jgi:hypothetical protein
MKSVFASSPRHDLERRFDGLWVPSGGADTGMATLGINKLREHATVVLILRRHRELHAFRAHLLVPQLEVGNTESELDFPCGISIGSGMECEGGLSGGELAPFGRLKLEWESNGIAIEPDGAVHIGHEFDHMCEFSSHRIHLGCELSSSEILHHQQAM